MKGIDWVAIDPGMADDPKIIVMAKALKVDRYALVGRFARFFGEVARHNVDGSIAGVDEAVLDAWAGDLRGFGAQVLTVMCNPAQRLTAWDRYNGKALEKLQKNRDRVAEYRRREAERRVDEEAARKAARLAHGNGTVREQSEHSNDTVRVQNADGTALTDTDTDTLSSSKKELLIISARARDALEAMGRDAPDFAPDLEAAFRSLPDPDAIAREMWALLDGMHLQPGQQARWVHIGQAARDAATNGERLTAKRLRIFVASLIREEAPQPHTDSTRTDSAGEARRAVAEAQRQMATRRHA